MRTKRILTTAMAVVAGTVAVSVQSAGAMEKPAKSDGMSMTYTGCVESVNHGYAFLLTNVMAGDSMHGDMPAKGDMTAKSAMAAPKMDAMSPKSFGLSGSASFGKYVGQKVSVTGSVAEGATGATPQEASMLTVKSLKVIAKSCS